jgi:hypothetical protein
LWDSINCRTNKSILAWIDEGALDNEYKKNEIKIYKIF